MPTVNFSVPEDIKNAFNSTFEGQNKSAVIAELMREAVERAHPGSTAQPTPQRKPPMKSTISIEKNSIL